MAAHGTLIRDLARQPRLAAESLGVSRPSEYTRRMLWDGGMVNAAGYRRVMM